ncbi:hypothetical protein AGMMS49957_01410 [Synergistales bacterium]|nr:hypothetical protein AGMMS49957_01410 [Synergistales bacterium]
MEVKVLSKDFLSDDPDIRRRALNLSTIKSAEKLKFTMKSKPASAKPKTTNAGATALGRPFSHMTVVLTHERSAFKDGRPGAVAPTLTEEEKRKALENTAEVLSMFDRSLRYEVIEEAELVQLNIIDNKDGSVVRKIPADVVVEFVKALKEKLDNVETEGTEEPEGLDVKA